MSGAEEVPSLAGYRSVVLLGALNISSSLKEALIQFANDGGQVILAAGVALFFTFGRVFSRYAMAVLDYLVMDQVGQKRLVVVRCVNSVALSFMYH